MGDDTTPDRGIRGMIRPEDTGYDTAWTSPEVVDCEVRSGRTRFTSLEGLPRSSAICRALKDI